jgi:hypothetical protein
MSYISKSFCGKSHEPQAQKRMAYKRAENGVLKSEDGKEGTGRGNGIWEKGNREGWEEEGNDKAKG